MDEDPQSFLGDGGIEEEVKVMTFNDNHQPNNKGKKH